MIKYILVTGGNVSSLGKGITSSTIGRLLKSRGVKVTIQKIDPYLNVDAGTMNPFQHGEVFVTEDGAETDLDLGHYERFVDINLSSQSNVTTGKIYQSVIQNERDGKYLGGTVQVIPHITNEIKARIKQNAKESRAEVAIVEIGGTVGDIESLPYLEAIRQFRNDVGREHCINIHLTLIPFLSTAGEMKTKLTQHSVKELRGIGIQPDIIVCRTRMPVKDELKAKISLFCDVPKECVIQAPDVSEIYEIPLNFEREGITDIIINKLGLSTDECEMDEWARMVDVVKNPANGRVIIGVIGKYVQLKDAYLSVHEALKHGGIANSVELDYRLIDSGKFEHGGNMKLLDKVHGILVPGGFGYRGIEGKIEAITHAREKNIPFFGICLGMQAAAIDFARNVCGLANANSSEFAPDTPHPVIDLMADQKKVKAMGATMRLGAYPCKLDPGSLAAKLYERKQIDERHRHRYEFNNAYREVFIKNGMSFSGMSPDGNLVEIMEYSKHPHFLAVQFHPEFKSRPTRPHPLFAGFIRAALKVAREREG